jgi:hypothetical protein
MRCRQNLPGKEIIRSCKKLHIYEKGRLQTGAGSIMVDMVDYILDGKSVKI